jgi:hypothetical protein
MGYKILDIIRYFYGTLFKKCRSTSENQLKPQPLATQSYGPHSSRGFNEKTNL